MLLLDHNISFKLTYDSELIHAFSEIQHIYLLNMHDEEDEVLWNYAKKKKLTIVTKDNDFQQFFSKWGFPPSVIKLNVGNCSNEHLKAILLKYSKEIKTGHIEGRLVIIEE